MTNAGVDKTEGSCNKESLAQSLRDLVAGWIERCREFLAGPKIVKPASKIGQVFVVGYLILELTNL